MKNYSQHYEQKHIIEFFNGKKGTLLSIGENDGQTFSNAYALIKLGWTALLVEPSEIAFEKLYNLHKDNNNVIIFNFAIGNKNGKTILYESGAHLADKSDYSLLSTIDKKESYRWKNVDFIETEVNVFTYKTVFDGHRFDFITIDAEGMDLDILRQIDLSNTQLICIEWNSKEEIKEEILEYTSEFGMNKVIYQSGENLLIAR